MAVHRTSLFLVVILCYCCFAAVDGLDEAGRKERSATASWDFTSNRDDGVAAAFLAEFSTQHPKAHAVLFNAQLAQFLKLKQNWRRGKVMRIDEANESHRLRVYGILEGLTRNKLRDQNGPGAAEIFVAVERALLAEADQALNSLRGIKAPSTVHFPAPRRSHFLRWRSKK